MVTNKVSARDLGRPRSFSDDDVFTATARAIARRGIANLTVEAVAAEVGCTGPALIRRFGSKTNLLAAYLDHTNSVSIARFHEVKAAFASPLAALRARFAIPTEARLDEVAPPAAYVNLVVFHHAAWADPGLRELEARRRRLFEDGISDLLKAALDAGELCGCDPGRLGRTLLAAMTGAALQWAGDAEYGLEERLIEVIDEIVQPYRG